MPRKIQNIRFVSLALLRPAFWREQGEGGGGFGASKDLQSISNKCYCLEISTLYRTEVANFINVFLKIVFTNDIITMAYHRESCFYYFSLYFFRINATEGQKRYKRTNAKQCFNQDVY